MTPAVAPASLLEANGIVKTFGHVEALRGVNLDVGRGEILALVGDNGAGKSTLISVISGALVPDAGTVTLEGEQLHLGSIEAAAAQGISTVYQDLALAPDLNAADNVFLSRELRRPGLLGRLGFMREKEMTARTLEELRSLGVDLPSAGTPVGSLSGGQRQVVAVARAALWASKLVILDEPTAALGVKQSEIVLDTILAAKERGLSVLLISHNLPHVIEVADRIAVLRLGTLAGYLDARTADVSEIVSLMLGGGTSSGARRRRSRRSAEFTVATEGTR